MKTRNTKKQLLAWILVVAMAMAQMSVLTYAEPISNQSVTDGTDQTDVKHDYDTGSINVSLSLAKDMTKECSDININDSIDVRISDPGDIMYYRFTPKEDIYGTFISHKYNACAYLFDENAELIKSDNISGYNGFRIEYQFEKGKVYYLGTCYNSESMTGTYNVRLKRANYMFTDYTEIKVGDKLTAELSDNDEILYYRFVPDKTIYCSFGAEEEPDEELDFELGIYDANGYSLLYVSSYDSEQFRYQFDEGETYYLSVSLSSSYNAGKFEVYLKQEKNILTDYKDYQLGDQMQILPDEDNYFRFIAPEDGLYEFLPEEYVQFDAYDSSRYELNSFSHGRIFYCYKEETYYLSANYSSEYNDFTSVTARLEAVECEDIKIGETVSYKGSARDRTKVIRFIPDETHGYALNYETEGIDSVRYYDYGCRQLDDLYIYNNNGIFQTDTLYAGNTYYIVAENKYNAENYAFKYSISYGEKGHDFDENNTCLICGQKRWYSIEGDVMTILHDTPDFNSIDYFFSYYENGYYVASKINSVVVNEGVKHLGNYLFNEFRNLSNVSLPDSLESIGEGTFYGCDNLRSITIPKNVVNIGIKAFRGDRTEYTLPEVIIAAKNTSFEWQSDMLIDKANGRILFAKQDISGEIIIPSGIKIIDEYAFCSCGEIESVTLPEGLVVIGDYAFDYCSLLTQLNLPESLIKIGEYAFYYTDIYSLTIPKNVEVMNNRCFGGCNNLEEVIFTGNVPKAEDSRGYFDNYTDLPLVIYYPNNNHSWDSINSYYEKWDFSGRIANWVPYTNLNDAKKQYNTISEPGFSDGDIVSFNGNYMNFRYGGLSTLQYPCEEAGGIYFLQHGLLKFFNMKTGICNTVYCFGYSGNGASIENNDKPDVNGGEYSEPSKVYRKGNLLYHVSNRNATVYNLADNKVERKYKLENFSLDYEEQRFNKICVDNLGRLYVYIHEYKYDEDYNYVEKSLINLYSAEGKLLDQIELPMGVFDIIGCGDNGEVYYWSPNNSESVHNNLTTYYSKVEGNRFVDLSDSKKFKECKNMDTKMIGYADNNFGTSAIENRDFIINKNGDVFSISNGRKVLNVPRDIRYRIDEGIDKYGYDTSFFGPSMIYDSDHDALIAYTKEKNLSVYDMQSGSVLNTFEAQHNIINMESYGDSVVILESEYDSGNKVTMYYIEMISKDSLLSDTSEVIASGYSGNTTWELTDTGVMTFEGSGSMRNYDNKTSMPWYDKADQIKKVVVEDGVTSVGENAFSGMSNLKSVVLADSVAKIGDFAFKNCTSLSNVQMPATMTRLGGSAFYGCTSLKSIEIPEGIYTVWEYCFKNCTSLESVSLPKSLIKLDEAAFYCCSALTSIEIPDNCSIIDVYCFKNCIKLSDVKLPATLGQIREAAFYATAIPSLDVPSKVTSVGPYAFKKCSSLARINLPESLTKIDEAAFYECDKLTSVEIPNAVTAIGNYAFRRCTGITSVKFPAGLKTVGECSFYGCTDLTSIVLPEGMTEIKDYAFKACSKLSAVTLPGTLETLGESAFNTCDVLASIVIPASVKTIKDYCFSGDVKLKNITFKGNAPAIGTGAFKNVTSKVYYPADDATWTSTVKVNYGGDLTWTAK